jgi:hypothetical protein
MDFSKVTQGQLESGNIAIPVTSRLLNDGQWTISRQADPARGMVQSKGTNGQSGIGTIEFLWTLGIICGALVAAGWALTYPLIVIGSTVAVSTIGGLIGYLKGYLDYKKAQKTDPFAMRSFDPTAEGIAIGLFVGLIGSIWYLHFFPIWANTHSLAQVARAFFWPF